MAGQGGVFRGWLRLRGDVAAAPAVPVEPAAALGDDYTSREARRAAYFDALRAELDPTPEAA